MAAEVLRKVAVVAGIEGMNAGAFCVFERLLAARGVDFGALSINDVCDLASLARDIYNDIYNGFGR